MLQTLLIILIILIAIVLYDSYKIEKERLKCIIDDSTRNRLSKQNIMINVIIFLILFLLLLIAIIIVK